MKASQWFEIPKDLSNLEGQEIKVGQPFGGASATLIVTIKNGLLVTDRGNEYSPNRFTHYKPLD